MNKENNDIYEIKVLTITNLKGNSVINPNRIVFNTFAIHANKYGIVDSNIKIIAS